MAFNQETGWLYEVHYAPEGSEGKSYAYAYNLRDRDQRKQFWDSHDGRNKIQLYSVDGLTNPAGTQKFFGDHSNKSWAYDLLDNNCKHYVMQGFEAGGASLPNQSAFPSSWPYGSSVGWLLPGTGVLTPETSSPFVSPNHKW